MFNGLISISVWIFPNHFGEMINTGSPKIHGLWGTCCWVLAKCQKCNYPTSESLSTIKGVYSLVFNHPNLKYFKLDILAQL